MAPLEGPQSPVLSLSPSSQQQCQQPNISSDNSNVSRAMNFDQTCHQCEGPPAEPSSQEDISHHQEHPQSQGSSPKPENSSPNSPVHHSLSQNANDQRNSITTNTSPSNPTIPVDQPSQFCPNCHNLSRQNQRLDRCVARLRMRLHESIETAQTHGQRLLRAAFQDKLRQITTEHAQRTTEMLNTQKKCFEDELQVMETETQSAIQALKKQLTDERDERDQLIFRYERERDDALEKTESTMDAVQRKLTHMQAKVTRLEREKTQLTAAHDQKQLMIDVLASTVAAKDVESRRLVVLEDGQEEERKRKNSLIDSLQREIASLRKQLEGEIEQNRNMTSKVTRLEKEHRDESLRHEKDLEDCKQESKMEIDRMGRLFASMIEDFAHVPADVTTSD